MVSLNLVGVELGVAEFQTATHDAAVMSNAADSNVLIVGIDEAGYGPILGPLVVSAVGFLVPRASADVPVRDLIGHCATTKNTAGGRRLPIVDSKKLYSRKDGCGRLEKTALSLVRAVADESAIACSDALLATICGKAKSLAEYPWYVASDAALPFAADAGAVRIAASQFMRGLAEVGVRLAFCKSEILAEGHYNDEVERTRNKATVSFAMVLRLIQAAAAIRGVRDVRFYIDRQGGRSHYGNLLMRSFEDRRLRVVDETDACSAYELRAGDSRWGVEFHTGGEDAHLPIAAASIVSKYVRELLMHRFNTWWGEQVADLRPTAGYYTDGMRFLRDIAPGIRRLGIQKSRLVRSR